MPIFVFVGLVWCHFCYVLSIFYVASRCLVPFFQFTSSPIAFFSHNSGFLIDVYVHRSASPAYICLRILRLDPFFVAVTFEGFSFNFFRDARPSALVFCDFLSGADASRLVVPVILRGRLGAVVLVCGSVLEMRPVPEN